MWGLSLLRSKLLVFVPLLLLLGGIMVACGDDATPTAPATSTSPSPTNTSPAPTATSPAPTATSPGPTATTVPGQPTRTSPAPTATSPPATPTSPAPTATPVPEFFLKAPEANPKLGGTLKWTAIHRPAHYDLGQATSTTYIWVLHHTFDNLVRFDPFGPGVSKVIPDLAKSWDISDDGLTYTFTLRDGVKWHDGTNMTAADVKATFDRIIFPPTGILSPKQAFFAAVTGIEVRGPKTVEFKLSKPQGLLLKYMSMPALSIMQKKALDENNLDLKSIWPVPGTGPFIMTERQFGEFHKYEKNPNYWNPDLPYLDGIVLSHAGWGPPTGAQFLAGQCDICFGLDPQTAELAKDKNNLTVFAYPSTSPQMMSLNNARAPFNDVRVRKAVHLAVDWFAVRKSVEDVLGLGSAGWLLAGDEYHPNYWAKAKDQPGWRKTTADDIAQAKKLLADAGYADGIKDPIVFLGRDSAKGRIVTATTAGLLKQVLGIESETFLNNSTIHYEIIAQQEYDIADTGAAQPLPVVHLYMGDLLSTDRSRNWHAYSNPALDKLVADMDVTSDPVKYGQQVQQIIDIMDQDVPFLIYGHASDRIGWTNIVKGNPLDQVNTTDDGGRTRMDTIWLDQ